MKTTQAKKWKLLFLGVFLSTCAACDTGGIVINANCRVGDGSCPTGQHCVAIAGGDVGSPGICRPSPRAPECYVGDNSCPEGLHCVGIADGHAGSPGLCRPMPRRPECMVGDDGACPLGYVCEGEEEGAPGFCKDVAECRVGDEEACGGDGYGCVGEPGAPDGSPGVCVDLAECRVGNDSKCPEGAVCVSEVHTGVGAPGRCQEDTLGNVCETDEDCLQGQVCEPNTEGVKVCIYGERDSGGKVVATLSHFQVRLNDELVVPLRAHGAPADNANAGWVGPKAAQMRVLARGPSANTGLEVHTSAGKLGPTECTTPAPCTDNCEWVCTLAAGWAGAEATTEVRLSIVPDREQVWRYRLSPPPVVRFHVPTIAPLGGNLKICASALTTGAPIASLNIASVEIWDTPALPALPEALSVVWTTTASPGKLCWTAALPLSLTWRAELSLRASATAEDSVGNVASATYDEPLELTRIACDFKVVGNDVNAPLVFSNGRLVFAAGTELYVFDTDTCSVVGKLLTGSVRNTMVALGDGSLAVSSTGRGASFGRWAPRLLMVDVGGAQPVFAQSPEEDCVLDTVGGNTGAFFEKGLSLLSLNPVRYASAASTFTDSVLMAYTPSEATEAERCILSGPIDSPMTLTLAQADNAEMLVSYGSLHGNTLKTMKFNATSAQWEKGSWVASHVSIGTLEGIALEADGSIWLSAVTPSSMAALQSWRAWERNPISPYMGAESHRFSPAAVDSQGRAFVVAYHLTQSAYQLHGISIGGQNVGAILPTGNATGMVGSPLLGQPRSGNPLDTEVYVIGNNGRVFGYRAHDLRRLWTVELGFHVSSTAQPVLVPHADGGGTLWVVGTEGHVRGIRVDNHGLSRTAPWPKAFRDNCNTSSRRVTPTVLPNCF